MRQLRPFWKVYDKITSWWCEQSAWKKATYIVGLTLSAGLVGLFIEAPTLLALSATFISFLGHYDNTLDLVHGFYQEYTLAQFDFACKGRAFLKVFPANFIHELPIGFHAEKDLEVL